MLSEDDYKELSGQRRSLNTDGRNAVREYETYHPEHAGLGASGSQKLRESGLDEPTGLNVPELPPETTGSKVGPQAKQMRPEDAALITQLTAETNASQDEAHDFSLPNASKLKIFGSPPEYVSKNPLAGFKHVALSTLIDPLEGPGIGKYHEPSEKQFQTDMGPVLKARGLARGLPGYDDAYNEYKDRKWQQAYEQAQAKDEPLTRVDYIPRSGSWTGLSKFLDDAPDLASSFVKGFASAGTLHATDAIATDADREQRERDPGASEAGEFAGVINPRGLLAQGASRVAGAVGKFLPSTLAGRLGAGIVTGTVASDADLAGRAGFSGLRSAALGESTQNAKDIFTQNILGSSLMGAGFGLGGSILSEGANSFQKHNVSVDPELAQLRRGGGDTDLLRGVRPGPDVAANIEAAREPIPGEAKPQPAGNATEIAAAKVQDPLAKANVTAHENARSTIAAQQEAAIKADPKLQERLPATKTAQAAVDWAISKLQPEARSGFLPGITKVGNAEILPGADLAEVQKLAPRLWQSRIVRAGEASNYANRALGRAVTLDEARQLGIDVGTLARGERPAPPPVAEASAPAADSNYDSAAIVANDVAKSTGALGDVQEFLNQGRRANGVAELAGEDRISTPGVAKFLRAAEEQGAAYGGPTYRGTSEKELEQLLKDGETAHTLSVSKDIEGALHFAKKGGVMLHIEAGSGAIPVDGIEGSNTFGESWIPRGQRFDVVSDSVENGVRTVRLKRASAPDLGGGSTAESVFGRPADKLSPAPPGKNLGPREGRARTSSQEPSSNDWFDPEKEALKFNENWSNRDFGESQPYQRTPPPNGAPQGDVPTRPAGLAQDTPTSPEAAAAPMGTTPSLRPSGPPRELATPVKSFPGSKIPTPPNRQPPSIHGIPESEYRVILEPRKFDARDFEEILGDVDRKAKAGTANAQPDPAWKQLQRAIREDRQQFGTGWTDLIAKHHELLNSVEQRSYHAGLPDKSPKPYSELSGAQQQTINGKLVNFPGSTDSAKALRELAATDPNVAKDLEVLGAQNAYTKLKGEASPRIGETIGGGGLTGHLRGLGPAVRLRADALARRVSAGPTGEPTVSPALADFVRQSMRGRSKFLPGITAMGNGALGLKAGAVYNSRRGNASESRQTLSPEETQFLEKLISVTQEARP